MLVLSYAIIIYIFTYSICHVCHKLTVYLTHTSQPMMLNIIYPLWLLKKTINHPNLHR